MKNRKNEFITNLKFQKGVKPFNIVLSILLFSLVITLLLGLIVTLGSCRKIDDHYNDYPSGYNNGLWEQIANDPADSVFVRLIKRVNLEKLISDNSSLTLWIPTNEACAKLNDLSDEDLKRVLMFHISISATQLDMISDSIRVQTLLGKYLTLVRSNGSYAVGESQVLNMNTPAKNGVIHQLSSVLEPRISLMEFLEARRNRYSLLYNHIIKYNKVVVDILHSVKIGYNDKGQSIYDTVKIRTNSFLKNIGDLYAENMSYTTNFASDNVFMQALSDHVYPYFTNLTGFNVATDTIFIPKLMDSLMVNNTFLNGVLYAPGKNTLQRSYVDTAWVKVAGGLIVPETYRKNVIVKAEKVDSMTLCSNGLAYVFKDLDIPKNWFSYPYGKLAHTYRAKFIDSLEYKSPIVSKGTITLANRKTNGKRYESYDPVRMEWFEATDSFIEYKVDVLPMRYKLVRECNNLYSGFVQASVSYNNDDIYTPVGEPFDNVVFANNPADNSGLTFLPAAWGRWVQPLTFTKPGVVKIRFTLMSGTAVNVHLIYLVPMD
jgi:hypothetical protein